VLGEIAEDIEMSESMFGSYYICSTTKSFSGASSDDSELSPEYRIAVE
jgi:hypothetical protein